MKHLLRSMKKGDKARKDTFVNVLKQHNNIMFTLYTCKQISIKLISLYIPVMSLSKEKL